MTQDEVLANASFMADHLLVHGWWDTVVVDIAWYDPTARAHGYNEGAPLTLDGYGRQLPAVNRFPSAAGGRGFAPLVDAVHALGLLFGVHVMRGVPRLAVEQPAGARHFLDRTRRGGHGLDLHVEPDNYRLDHDHAAAQAYVDSQVAQLATWGVDLVKVDDMLAPYHAQAIESWPYSRRKGFPKRSVNCQPASGFQVISMPWSWT